MIITISSNAKLPRPLQWVRTEANRLNNPSTECLLFPVHCFRPQKIRTPSPAEHIWNVHANGQNCLWTVSKSISEWTLFASASNRMPTPHHTKMKMAHQRERYLYFMSKSKVYIAACVEPRANVRYTELWRRWWWRRRLCRANVLVVSTCFASFVDRIYSILFFIVVVFGV